MASLPGWNSIETSAWLHDFFELGGIILFLVVVAFELLGYFYGHRKDWLVEEASRVATVAQRQATEAEEKRHNDEVEALKQRLAEASKKVVGLTTQTVARRLTDSEKTVIIAALSPFAGQKVEIWCSNTAWDCINFAKDFHAAFKAAKWDIPDDIRLGAPLGFDPTGIEIAVNPAWFGEPANAPPALNALGVVLRQFGFLPTPGPLGQSDNIEPGTISFRIGRIPPPH